VFSKAIWDKAGRAFGIDMLINIKGFFVLFKNKTLSLHG
jgi:hypothetical protein